MPSIKFHIVTLVGIFLALAVGIFIGSTFTEETIILQQRDTIERMKADLEDITGERSLLVSERDVQATTLALLQDWLGAFRQLYFEANPLERTAALIYGEGFETDLLGGYFCDNVVKIKLAVDCLDIKNAEVLAAALIQGNGEELEQVFGPVAAVGQFERPDYVLLAPPVDLEQWPAVKIIAITLLNAEFPVVAIGKGGRTELAALVEHPLFASVSHLDSPLGLYCLDAVLRGQGGHYGMELLLPERDSQ